MDFSKLERTKVSVDRFLSRAAKVAYGVGFRPPSVGRLSTVRQNAADDIVETYRGEAEELVQLYLNGDRQCRDLLAVLAEDALAEMRHWVLVHSSRHGGLQRSLAESDRLWLAPNLDEYLDDPDFDKEKRIRVLNDLDSLNQVLGSYRHFYDVIKPYFNRDGGTRILDLAAGHGGFALEIARLSRKEGADVSVTATDLKPEYLELGRQHALREKLPVSFAPQDALDLSNLATNESGVSDYDIILCTQSQHHFPPGLLNVMFNSAARATKRAVVFIDGCRSSLNALPVVSLALARYKNLTMAHDSLISFRKFFVPEELGMLCRLGPWDTDVEVRWMKPGHCLVVLDKDRVS